MNIIRDQIKRSEDYIVDQTVQKLEQKFNDMGQDYKNIVYQTGCAGKAVSFLKWSLVVIGGGGYVGAAVEIAFKISVTIDPLYVIVGSSTVGTVSLCAAYCLGRKANLEEKEGKKYFEKLKGLYLTGIREACNESSQKTEEVINQLSIQLNNTQQYANQAGHLAIDIHNLQQQQQQNNRDTEANNQKTKEMLDQISEKTPLIHQKDKEDQERLNRAHKALED